MKSILSTILLWVLRMNEGFEEGVHILNKGTPNNNVSNLLRRLKRSVLKHHPSLVIVMIGTNDMVNPQKWLSYRVYKNNLDRLVTRIKNNGTDVLLLSLPPVNSIDLLSRRSWRRCPPSPNDRIEAANKIISMVANEKDCMYLDIHKIFKARKYAHSGASSLIRNKINSGTKDGVHPTSEGYAVMAENIAGYLKSRGGRWHKIICFGDSITFGAFVKGGGRTRGESYPAILKKLLFPSD